MTTKIGTCAKTTTKRESDILRDAGVKMALGIIEEGKRPMSPDQIKGKYQLEFPFTVKRVIAWTEPLSQELFPCGCHKKPASGLAVGDLLTFTGIAGNGSYLHATCPCGVGKFTINGSSERFVLA